MDERFLDRLSGILTDAEWQYMADSRKNHPVTIPAPEPKPQPDPCVKKLASGVHHEYSTMYPGSDHLAFLFLHPGGFIGVHNADGTFCKMLPGMVNHSSQPRWSRKKPTCFYYLYLNELRMFDIANDSSVTVRKFKELPGITGMGESDISEDDNHLVLCSGQYVFVYEISTDRILEHFTAVAPFNNLYIDPQNRPIIGHYGERGIQILDKRKLRKVAAALGHMDISSDKDGNPIMVWSNAADDTGKGKNAALANCRNGIVRIDLNTGKQSCLTEIDWAYAVHISLPERAQFALVTTYNASGGEILKVALDGSGVKNLIKHGSKADVYERQPKASVSPDGTRYVFDSNGDVFMGTL